MIMHASRKLYTLCRENRFLFLFIAVLCYLLAFPFLQPFVHFRLVLSLTLTFVLISAVYAVSGHKRTTIIASVLAVIWGLLQWASNIVQGPVLEVADSSIAILFLGYIIYKALIFFGQSKKVDFNIVSASVVVYLLMALLWAETYTLIEIASPGSFNFAVTINDAGGSRFTYFSFVTITTLGYGDIIPASNMARVAAMVEAFVGQVYLVVLVARMVGMHLAQSLNTPEK
jgi:hypothetical protein